MSDLETFFVHTVTLTPLTGVGAYGDVYGPPVADVPCMVDETTRMVRDREGSQVVSSATVYAAPDAPAAPPGSLMTLTSGRTAVVITETRRTAPGLDLPEHTAWALT
jgi:hypothetical protein